MKDQSPQSGPMISSDTASATSSPASEAGPSLFASPDGQTIDMFGRVAVPVNRSRASFVVGAFAGMTQNISGPFGRHWSLNSRLTLSLANRLLRPGIGLMAYAMTWKEWVTPSGRRFCRLQLSAKAMRALGFTLHATPTATANQACPSMAKWPGCKGFEVTADSFREKMGYPQAWLKCSPVSEIRSSLKSQPNSSNP